MSKTLYLILDTLFGIRKSKISFMNKHVGWTWKTTFKAQINTKSYKSQEKEDNSEQKITKDQLENDEIKNIN
jgi:hypothetical protein